MANAEAVKANVVPVAKLTEVKEYFGFLNSKEFRNEWKELSDDDKAEIRTLLWKELYE